VKKQAKPEAKAKVLLLDCETAPILGYVWGLWENNVALNQIAKDWHLLSWSAKWLNAPASEILYMDQRNAKKIEDDSRILKGMWKLLDQADVVITHNGISFDARKLNARFIQNGMKPPSSYKHLDTKRMASRHFAFTSNKLEYIADKLNVKYKKKKHTKFPGFELWRECLAGNQEAWDEMETYNKYDVLVLEELYHKLVPWDGGVNLSLYSDAVVETCHNCGGAPIKWGFYYTAAAKYQRYKCAECGTQTRGKENLFSAEKKKSIRPPTKG
jgi:hypothetical protein